MSELTEYAKQILQSFKKKILEYFDSIKSEKNLALVDYVESVQVQKAQIQEFTVGIPLEKGKKVDFGIEIVEYEMPTLAIVKFRNFPLSEVVIRIAFPATLFGPKGEYPKIIFTSTLKQAWPGEFGLVWTPITGSTDAFAFHPYQNKENKMEDLTKFYSDNIVDPLCDFLNTAKYKVAIKLRENIKKFLESKEVEVWSYQNPFKKKEELISIDLPIYCEFFDENDASILYVECYSLKNYWIPPAYIIYDIMQYIGLATEMFDADGNLLPEDKLQHVSATLEKIESTSEEVEKTKKSMSLKQEWDPFKPVKAAKRDVLGFEVADQDGSALGAEHHSVIEKVERMKALMQQRASVEVEKPIPPVLERPAPAQEEKQVEPSSQLKSSPVVTPPLTSVPPTDASKLSSILPDNQAYQRSLLSAPKAEIESSSIQTSLSTKYRSFLEIEAQKGYRKPLVVEIKFENKNIDRIQQILTIASGINCILALNKILLNQKLIESEFTMKNIENTISEKIPKLTTIYVNERAWNEIKANHKEGRDICAGRLMISSIVKDLSIISHDYVQIYVKALNNQLYKTTIKEVVDGNSSEIHESISFDGNPDFEVFYYILYINTNLTPSAMARSEPQLAPPIAPKIEPSYIAPLTQNYEPKPPSIQFEDDSPQIKPPITSPTEIKPQYWGSKLKTTPPVESQSPATKIIPAAAKPAAVPPTITAKEFFQEFQMRQFVMVGNGSDLPFKIRGDFKMLQMLNSPYILSFARDQLRNKKNILPSEAIDLLFELYKTGHIRAI